MHAEAGVPDRICAAELCVARVGTVRTAARNLASSAARAAAVRAVRASVFAQDSWAAMLAARRRSRLEHPVIAMTRRSTAHLTCGHVRMPQRTLSAAGEVVSRWHACSMA